MHTGTHIDGPMHMTKSDRFIDELSLERFFGTGCFLNAAGMKVIAYTPEFASAIVPESIVLIYTGFRKQFGSEKYYRDHPVVSMELAQLFVEQRIKMACWIHRRRTDFLTMCISYFSKIPYSLLKI